MSSAPLPEPGVALRFVGVGKTFPGVRALHDVSFTIAPGSVHALCGENGAGKSTLGKIVAGIHAPDRGHLEFFGARVRFDSPREALLAGIGMVHQELSFCENLSVAENLCLGALPSRGLFVDGDRLVRKAREIMIDIEPDVDVRATIGSLPLAVRQMVQIASAVAQGARAIVFDEPTSSLSQEEAERLYALIGRLREGGVTSIFVSHRMDEIFRLCDALSVLRDGRHIATTAVASSDEASLVRMMIGRNIEVERPRPRGPTPGPELLRVERLSSPGRFSNVSFSLRGGEILGLAGLVGAGRTEIAHALFGLDPSATGLIEVDGRRAEIDSPITAMEMGLGLVPEDRKRQGLIMGMSVQANLTLPILRRLARAGFVKHREERRLAGEYFDRLRVRTPGPESETGGLSGGNQQKVVLARWLAARAKVLILDEPTRGVDVGAKAEIHGLIEELAGAGLAILLISSELPEVLRLSSRVLVLREGGVTGEVSRAEATPDGLLRLMTGLCRVGELGW